MRQSTRVKRFSSRYVVNARSGCWEWIGTKDKDGYGKFGQLWGGRATRFSYSHYKGEIPRGMFVCHSCDNPSCVNPDHLWLGTPADNMRDRNLKGRQAKHDRIRPTITKEVAYRAQQEMRDGLTQKSAAEKYGISRGMASMVARGLTWHFRA
jgi:hypothetical protein